MSEYRIKISGVHYGANGDSVAGQEETAEMHERTIELLTWIDHEKPIVVLAPDLTNHIHKNAIMARAQGRRIGRVAFECVDLVWALLHQSGQPMMIAEVVEVAVKKHGYVMVTVDANELQAIPSSTLPEIEWGEWINQELKLPRSEQLEKELEAAFVLESLFLPNLAEANIDKLKIYLNLWLEGGQHDLSREARQKRSAYIECLEAAQDKEVRLLAEPLKEQRARICERAPLDEHATVWWQERMKCLEVQQMWERWRLKNNNKLWLGLRRIDTLLRKLSGELYNDIGQLDVVLSRLYYMNTPLEAFQAILAQLMLRDLACRELGIEMRPMTEEDYEQSYAQQMEVLAATGPLATEQAKKYWKRLMEEKFVDERFMLLESTTRQQAMYIAELFAEKMGIKSKWKTFEDLWGINNLAQEKQKCTDLGKLPARSDVIDKIFED